MPTRELLERYDRSRMYEVYDRWPDMAREAFEAGLPEISPSGIDHIVFAGMGGSGTVGDVFSAILSKTTMHTSVVKGYLLPRTVDGNTLVVCTSVSGDTVETLSVFDAARKTDCTIACFSSGGKLMEGAQKYDVFHQIIPRTHSPRGSFVGYLYSILRVLGPVLPVSAKQVENSLAVLEELSRSISSYNLGSGRGNLAAGLARDISGTPVLYYPAGLMAAAIRFKNSLQENAKMPAMVEDVVEASHNNLVSWESKPDILPILLRGQDDHYRTRERWEIFKKYFGQNDIPYLEIDSVHGDILTKIVHSIYLLDYTSIYLAVSRGIDPTPVRSIEFARDLMGS